MHTAQLSNGILLWGNYLSNALFKVYAGNGSVPLRVLNCTATVAGMSSAGSALSPDGNYAYFGGAGGIITKVDFPLNTIWSYTARTTSTLFAGAVTDSTGRTIYWGASNYLIQVAPGSVVLL